VTTANKVNTSRSARKRISATLKKKWEDPVFRERMMEKIRNRSASNGERSREYREKISKAMKAKWSENSFREKALVKIRARAARMRAARPPKPPKAPRPPRPRKKKEKKVKKPRGRPRKVDAFGNPIPPRSRTRGPRKKKKESDKPLGSIDRLREERRDLFDLLYGDDAIDEGANDEIDDDILLDEIERTLTASNSFLDVGEGDEDLESFDPYGLE